MVHLPRIGRSFAWNWFLFSAVLIGLALTWSVATPLPSGPDETAHYVEAAAVVRGHVGGTEVPGKRFLIRKRVPAEVRYMGIGRICYYQPSLSAACDRDTPASPSGTTHAATYVGNYPPLYYALTGWPSLISTSRVGLRAVRAMSAVLGGVLLGLAFATARRWSQNRLLPLALGLALTPAVVYLNAVLNPSGFEISAAAVLWTAAAVLILERDDEPPRGLVAVAGVAAVLLAFTRPISPIFVLLILGGLAVLRPRRCRELLRSRAVRVAGGVIAVAVLIAGIFVLLRQSYVVERFPLSPALSQAEIVRLAVGHVGSVTTQLFGGYGSPNFGAPLFVLVVWGGSAMLLLGVALLVLPRGEAVLLATGLVLVLLVLPLGIDLSGARTLGLAWQGRYQMPLLVGGPLIAAALLARLRVATGRAHLLGPLVIALGLLVSYFWVVRRYQLGLFGPLNPFPSGPDVWQPPIPGAVLFVLAAGLCAAYGGLLYRSSRPVGTASTTGPAGTAEPTETAEPVIAEAKTGSAVA